MCLFVLVYLGKKIERPCYGGDGGYDGGGGGCGDGGGVGDRKNLGPGTCLR